MSSIRTAMACTVALATLATLGSGCDQDRGDGVGAPPALTITDQGRKPVGPDGEGAWLLPNGRRIQPLGTMVRVPPQPLAVALTPDGATLFVNASGDEDPSGLSGRRLTAVDTRTAAVVAETEQDGLFLGVAVTRDGSTVYAAGGAEAGVVVYDWDGSSLSRRAIWGAEGYHGGLALSPDERVVFVVDQIDGGLTLLDAATGEVLGRAPTGANAWAVVVSPDGREAYVSAERAGEVQVYDVSDPRSPRQVARIAVQKNPEGLALSADGRRLFVANADEDTASIVNLATRKVERTIDLRTLNVTGYGTGPNGLAFSPDGARLYVAQAADNRVAVIDVASGTLVGAIPTAWYPTALAVSPDGRRLYIANMKGIGTGPDGEPDSGGLTNRATVQLVDIPADAELAAWVARIDDHNRLAARLFEVDRERFRNPVPLERGGDTPIEHVFLIVRENQTYDALLGDWPGGNGDPRFCKACDYVVNIRALAERFASGDNYYSNAESSDQGHMILTSAISNTYHEKARQTEGRPFSNELDVFANPTAVPKREAIFQELVRKGVPFKNFGEAIGMLRGNLILKPEYASFSVVDPPFYYTFSRDVDKVAQRIERFESEGVPPFVFMLLPNDHTNGCSPPNPTPRSMIADNDLATGQFVEWLSASPYWATSVVFIVEDDPQGSDDHVDSHRSILSVISPYARRGYVSPVRYHEGNLLATIEYLLGLDPLSIYDEIAQPMWDMFQNEPDLEPYVARPRLFPEEISLPGTNCGFASRGLHLVDPDQAENLGEIVFADQLERRADADGAEITRRWQAVFESVERGGGAVWEMLR